MTEQIVYPFFGEQERKKLIDQGYRIIDTKETPCIMGHGGDIIVTIEKNETE